MKIKDLLLEGNKYVHKDQSKLILSILLGFNPLELSMHLEDRVNDKIKTKFIKCVRNIRDGIPIQYALNSVNFYGLDYYVDERVLIPRYETEELVFNTNKYLNKYFNKNAKILDLGTGSGCIGLTLKYFNNDYDITLSDISTDALVVANYNCKKLKLDAKVIESNLFNNIFDKYDVIISNPPYIAYDDIVDEIVLKNEPHLALFANNNGLEYYERILKDISNYLNEKYLIAFEIGASQKDKILDIIYKYLKDVKVITKQDMSKRDRMVFIFKNIDINE